MWSSQDINTRYCVNGAGERNRTFNLLITSQLLYHWATPALIDKNWTFESHGGQGWIRTIEDIVDGFTVRCIWPLCNLPKLNPIFAKSFRQILVYLFLHLCAGAKMQTNPPLQEIWCRLHFCTWCPKVESNHRHRDFQSLALPTELSGHNGDLEGARTLDL